MLHDMAADDLCPVCGYDLGGPAWPDGEPSDEICPSCGLQFGYQDMKARREGKEDAFYHGWRACWLTHGAPWSSRATKPPSGWDARAQVQRLASRG
jgi:hypothetical protein